MRTEHKILLTRSHHKSRSAKNNTVLKKRLSENLNKSHLEQQYLGSLIPHGNGRCELLVSNDLTEHESFLFNGKTILSLSYIHGYQFSANCQAQHYYNDFCPFVKH